MLVSRSSAGARKGPPQELRISNDVFAHPEQREPVFRPESSNRRVGEFVTPKTRAGALVYSLQKPRHKCHRARIGPRVLLRQPSRV